MADITKGPADELFASVDTYEELRALVRTKKSAEEVARLSPAELTEAARVLSDELHRDRRVAALINEHVKSGRLDATTASRMTPEERRAYQFASVVAGNLRTEMTGGIEGMFARSGLPQAPEVQESAPIPEAQLVAVLGDMLSLMAAQQAQIDELVYERDVFFANFTSRILDRLETLSDKGRNYKGFEVTLDLEDEHSESVEKSAASKAQDETKSSNARDTHGELKVLASQIGALGAGRKVNVDEMNKKVASLTASAKSAMKARRKGKLTVKMGEISGEKKE